MVVRRPLTQSVELVPMVCSLPLPNGPCLFNSRFSPITIIIMSLEYVPEYARPCRRSFLSFCKTLTERGSKLRKGTPKFFRKPSLREW